MSATDYWKLWCGRAGIVVPLLLALLAGGCSGGAGLPSTAPTDSAHGFSGSSSLSDVFTGSSAKSQQGATGAQPDVNCPPVDVRQGASTLAIGPTGNKTAM